ncbi:MAG: UDP-N-acetylmuramoyl-L-alanyl-D-glutamate--2,6-diaminopimelate ligase [Butyrivibrio sp.]|nr:UDP-N-acetylmuramoyl-L-alanyl-D-glutamate--2,6-diaminopimelate ligase [Butyrivibrio sp.]
MILRTLIEKLEYSIVNGDENINCNKLVYDSRIAGEADVFVCISGAVSDGHKFISQVVDKKVAAIVVEKDVEITEAMKDITIVRVDDTRLALAYMSAAYFDNPSQSIFTIGITGTKGKTTTTFMVRNILEACGIKTGLIGTIETIIGDEVIPSKNTTPESYKVQEYFRKMVDAGCRCVVMEVSSQALMLHRTAGIVFDIGVFTNLEPDHIGTNEHKDYEDYMRCKGLLFKQCIHGIINVDSPDVMKAIHDHTCTIETYGIHNDRAMLTAKNISYSFENGCIITKYQTEGILKTDVMLHMPGEFSVYNSLCAIAITKHFNVDEEKLCKALLEVMVPGRVELVPVSDEYTAMVDFAHNAMSLKSLLETLKEYHPKRLVTLFGCGGERAVLRRSEMGEVSGKLSDFTIITSDNPKSEDPEAIMRDIEESLSKYTDRYVKIADRVEAVNYAIKNAEPGDIIVFAGKGHETYQEIAGEKVPYNERETVLMAVERNRRK